VDFEKEEIDSARIAGVEAEGMPSGCWVMFEEGGLPFVENKLKTFARDDEGRM